MNLIYNYKKSIFCQSKLNKNSNKMKKFFFIFEFFSTNFFYLLLDFKRNNLKSFLYNFFMNCLTNVLKNED